MSGLLLLFTLALLITAGGFYYRALEQVRPWFPPNLKDELTARFALDAFIWERSFPADARRKYLVSVGFAAIAFLCPAIALYLQSQFFFAGCFVCLSLLQAGYGLMRWAKYKDRL
jgi:hypothetical protein